MLSQFRLSNQLRLPGVFLLRFQESSSPHKNVFYLFVVVTDISYPLLFYQTSNYLHWLLLVPFMFDKHDTLPMHPYLVWPYAAFLQPLQSGRNGKHSCYPDLEAFMHYTTWLAPLLALATQVQYKSSFVFRISHRPY